MSPVLSLSACFLTPLWPDGAIAPGGSAPWGGPSDTSCIRQGDVSATIDGYLLCGGEGAADKIPIDDPLYGPCLETDLASDALVLSLFDGDQARGYPVGALTGRELVNTEWKGEPVLVDY